MTKNEALITLLPGKMIERGNTSQHGEWNKGKKSDTRE